jgi:hypothetical protein
MASRRSPRAGPTDVRIPEDNGHLYCDHVPNLEGGLNIALWILVFNSAQNEGPAPGVSFEDQLLGFYCLSMLFLFFAYAISSLPHWKYEK